MPIKDVDIIHIGLPKCGSNYIQKGPLLDAQNIELICPKFTKGLKEPYDAFLSGTKYIDHANLREKTLSYFQDENKLWIVSQEDFCGDMITGDGMYRSIIDLRQMFTNASIMLVIRNPIDYLKSIYGHIVRRGVALTFKEFVSHNYILKSEGYTFSPAAHLMVRLQMLRLGKRLEELFGSEKVIILDFDLMVSQPDYLFRKIGLSPLSNTSKRSSTIYNKGLKSPSLTGYLNKFARTPFNYPVLPILPFRAARAVGHLNCPMFPSKARIKNIMTAAASNDFSNLMTEYSDFSLSERGKYGYKS
ncbi:hypothetical protein N9X22_06890 [Planktomarina temperata]|nr:hypothetical protein [Planktomarina temperata]